MFNYLKIGYIFLLFMFSCQEKQGLITLRANSEINNTYWYEVEQSFYHFYKIKIPEELIYQGKLEFLLDNNWVNSNDITSKFQHNTVDCGPKYICGSYSLDRTNQAAAVTLRFNYTLDSNYYEYFESSHLNVTSSNPSPTSFEVYGSFDKLNTSINWLSRNTFPNISNEDVNQLGIVREYVLNNRVEITSEIAPDSSNPSLFRINESCSGSSNTESATSDISTAYWDNYIIANDDNIHGLCASGYMNIIKDNFNFRAIARKNPVTRDFGKDLSLRFSNSEIVYISFQDCNTTPGWDYFAFQKDQLLVTTFEREYCINDGLFNETTSRNELLADLTAKLATTALNISYAFVLSYPEQGDSAGFYQSLDNIMTSLLAASNRVQGMIVYDSYVRESLLNAVLSQEVIWCPSIQQNNLGICNILSPLEISGGPISLGLKPVFPSFDLYEDENDSSIWPEAVSYDFWSVLMSSDIEQYSEFSEIDIETGSEVFNHYFSDINDLTSITPEEKLSYCPASDITGKLAYYLPDDTQEGNQWGYLADLPLQVLDDSTNTTIQLGLVADYMFYLEYVYKQFAQGNIENIPGTIPLSGAFNSSDFLGDDDFTRSSFGADKSLVICEKFCTHPIYNESGEYLIGQDFESYYQSSCYYPAIAERP